MDPKRRQFLELFVPTKAYAGNPQMKFHLPHYAMLVDLRRCVGCQACTIACGVENGLPDEQHRTTVADYEMTIFGRSRRSVLPRLCNHCEKPSCTAACPTGATYKREDGVVVVDSSVCVGCAYCVQSCPYDARFMNDLTRTADKCTFCIQRINNGLLPACVESCVGKARIFGDLNAPNSTISKILRDNPTQVLKSSKGNGPQVFYLALESALQNTVQGKSVSLVQGHGSAKKG